MYYFIAIVLMLIACTNPQQEVPAPVPIFTQSTLRSLIVNNENEANSMRIKRLKAIMNNIPDSATFTRVAALLFKSFSDANSPYRNEDICFTILQKQLETPWYTSEERSKFKNKLGLLSQNRPGHPANDFIYFTPAGAQRWMYTIQSPRLLLFFYNPECDACKQSTAAIAASAVINKKIRTHELAVLAIYTDKGTRTWRKHLPALPVNWLHGRDSDEYLYTNGVYDLSAIPTIYLLDKDKNVILKDCMDIIQIEKALLDSGY